jgi:hypothetical protein
VDVSPLPDAPPKQPASAIEQPRPPYCRSWWRFIFALRYGR